MVKKKRNFTEQDGLLTNMHNDRGNLKCKTLRDFFELHEKLIQDKALEGPASRTMEELKTKLGF